MLETIIKWLSYVISCSVGTAILFDFMNKMYEPQYLKKRTKIILYFLFTILWISVNLLDAPFLNFTYFVAITFIVAYLYNVRRVKEYLHIIIFNITFAGCDAIVSSLLTLITGSIPLYNHNSVVFLFNVIVVQTFMFAVCKLLIICFKRQKITYMYKKQYVFLALLPVSNVAIIYFIAILAAYKVDPTTTHFIIMMLAVISIILNLAVIYFFENVSKSDQLESEIVLIQQRMDMQYSYYQQLEIEYNNSQKIMHDIKNHVRVFERLYTAGQNTEGIEYAKKISEIVDELGMKFNCNNRILNIIVNEKMKICHLDGIEFIYSVENLNLNFIDDIDITAIFANLLDNAIEACNRIIDGTKRIELRIYQFHDMFIINLINSIQEIPVKSEEKFLSNKKNHKAIGLSNVNSSVKKYDGDINIEVEQGRFSVSIIFPVSRRSSSL
ncbi:sensor histidine kinase YesM [Clostridium sp. KNHs216]|nr:sensor histidine kinase YesM [Clostridium sp. KNHs216]